VKDLTSQIIAVAFWLLLAAAAVTVLATVAGHLLPASLDVDDCGMLGTAALGLALSSHLLPLVAAMRRAAAPRPQLVGPGVGSTTSFQALSSRK